MAWIETYLGEQINLDRVDRLIVRPRRDSLTIDNTVVLVDLVAILGDRSSVITTADPDDENHVRSAARAIAQIARGNAYISQDDVSRMINEERRQCKS